MNYQELIAKYDNLCANKKNLQDEKKRNMNDKRSKRLTIKNEKFEIKSYIYWQKREQQDKQLSMQNQGQNAQAISTFKRRFMIKDQQKKEEIKQQKLNWITLRNDMKQLKIRNKEIQVELKQLNMQIREIKPEMKQAKIQLKTTLKQMKVDKNKSGIIEYRQVINQMKQVVDKYSNRKKKIVITKEQYLQAVREQLLDNERGISGKLFNCHKIMISKQLTSSEDFCFQPQEAKDDTLKFLKEYKIPHVYVDDIDRSLSNPERLKGVLSFYPVLNAKTIKAIRSNKNVAHIIGSSLEYHLRHKFENRIELFNAALKLSNPPKKIQYSLDQDLINFGLGIFMTKHYEFITGVQFSNSRFQNIQIYHCEQFEFPIEIQQELKQILKKQVDIYTENVINKPKSQINNSNEHNINISCQTQLSQSTE